MQTSRIRLVTRALALLVVSSILTTCGDDSSSSNDDPGVFGEMADVLMQAEADYLTANAEILASAEYMEPFIAELLNSAKSNAMQSIAQTSCLPEGMGGRTYTINGTPFTSIVDPAVPAYTARFRLFRLSTANEPLLNQEIGYVDYTCVHLGLLVSEVQVFSDSVLVASTTYPGETGTISHAFRVPDGSRTLQSLGELTSESGLDLRYFLNDEFKASYHSAVGGLGSDRVEAKFETWPDTVWALRVAMDIGETGAVSDSGYALYFPTGLPDELEIAACIVTGTVDDPAFTAPSTACYDGAEPMPVNSAQLQAMADSYRLLRKFWLTASHFVDICRSLVPVDK